MTEQARPLGLLQRFATHFWPAPEDISARVSIAPAWWLRLLLASIGGCLVFLAYPNYNLYYLAYFALVFELWAIEGASPRAAFGLGFLAGAITNIGGFYWITNLLIDFGHMSFGVAVAICGLACLTQGVVFALWAYIIRKLDARFAYLSAIAAMIVVEWLYPMIFPWYLGNSQYLFVLAVQTADIFGVQGVSLVVVIVNVLLYDLSRAGLIWYRDKRHTWNKAFYALALSYLVFCFGIYGPIRMAQVDAIQAEVPSISVGMVEADVGIWEKEDPDKLRNNLFTHHLLTKQLNDMGAELIIWPESSYQAGYIWGSHLPLTPDQPTNAHEIDALYASWFQPHAARIYGLIDASFGEGFVSEETIHESLHRALFKVGENLSYKSLANNFGSLVGGYHFPCSEAPPNMMRCPYPRLIPDDLTYYLPSHVGLKDSRKSDLLRLTMPFDMLSPLRDNKAAMLFGTLTVSELPDADVDFKESYQSRRNGRKLYNTAHLIDSDGRILGRYHKNALLLFGEYTPFADTFPIIYELLPEAGNLTRGSQVETMKLRDGVVLGPIICYEDILPRYVRELSKLRPNIFVNITNDAWFGKTSEPYLHMALSVMRSVEHRKWLVRSTNTGVSVFVDAVGRIVGETSIYDSEVLQADVKIMPPTRSIYSYIGDFLAFVSSLWILGLFVLKAYIRRRQR